MPLIQLDDEELKCKICQVLTFICDTNTYFHFISFKTIYSNIGGGFFKVFFFVFYCFDFVTRVLKISHASAKKIFFNKYFTYSIVIITTTTDVLIWLSGSLFSQMELLETLNSCNVQFDRRAVELKFCSLQEIWYLQITLWYVFSFNLSFLS